MSIPDSSAAPARVESRDPTHITSIDELTPATISMLVEVFNETAAESRERQESRLTAIREGVVAASMALVAMTSIDDKFARELVRKWAHNNPDLEF